MPEVKKTHTNRRTHTVRFSDTEVRSILRTAALNAIEPVDMADTVAAQVKVELPKNSLGYSSGEIWALVTLTEDFSEETD